jgi:NADH-quinone oxidoreductase subunit A
MTDTGSTTLLWPLLVYGVAVVLLVGGLLLITHFLGERHQEHATEEVYEGGIMATGSARLLFPAHFYIIAIFFVVFDVQAFFIMAWAISIRSVGWAGYTSISVFISILAVVLLYVWRIGALDFGPDGKKILKAYYRNIKKPSSL